MMRSREQRWLLIGIAAALYLYTPKAADSAVEAHDQVGQVKRKVSLGEPSEYFIEDEYEAEGLRRVVGGSVLLALPSDWDRAQPLHVKLTWAVRDDFPVGEPASPRLFVRGALVGEGDYYHSKWLHPDEQDLEQEPVLEVGRPDYGLDQGELMGHPYRGACSTLASATIVIEPERLTPTDELLALYLEPEWNRWPQPGAVDGSLLSHAHLSYMSR